MNLLQGTFVPMATTSQPNQETQELARLFDQTKKTLPILSEKDTTAESVKPVLNTLTGYELNHENPQLSIKNVKISQPA